MMNVDISKLMRDPNIVKLGISSTQMGLSVSHTNHNYGLVDLRSGSGSPSANYQVPAGKKFIPIALYARFACTSALAGQALGFFQSTAACAIAGQSASPTGQADIVGYEGDSNGNTITQWTVMGVANTVYEITVPVRPNLGVAANNFVFFQWISAAIDLVSMDDLVLFGTLG